ncbi:MAG: hypothetical protein JSV49_09630 [Thermoplasmata archaeon]|nr:MAG: hypothetical protein JSV49_09630 [Thermoplasmata archaeon]
MPEKFEEDFFYEVKKPFLQRYATLVFVPMMIFTIILLILVIIRIISYVPIQGQRPDWENCSIIFFIIMIVAFIIMIYVLIRVAYPWYLIRIYKNGVRFTIRKQGITTNSPKSARDILKIRAFSGSKIKVTYVSFDDLSEIWAMPIKWKQYGKGGFIGIKEYSGQWYILQVPANSDINEAMDWFKVGFGERWEKVYSGTHQYDM